MSRRRPGHGPVLRPGAPGAAAAATVPLTRAGPGAGRGLIRRSRRAPGRRRRRFSLNGLAIQLSAFALSFTLVALLVVTGSQAAFVEENESVTNYVPVGAPAEEGGRGSSRRPSPAVPALPATTIAPSPPAAPAEVPAEVPVEAVALTDRDAGSAMFSDAAALPPGVPLDRCIEVTYEGGSTALPVQLYAAGIAGDLAPYLDLTVELGVDDAGSFGSCATFLPSETLFSGTLADFAAGHPDYGTGLRTWHPTGTADARSFRFTVAVRDDPEASGRSTSFGFTWESRGD
jgi:hypothetical protein